MQPTTLIDLLQEHFDGVLSTIEKGQWGRWLLDRPLAERGHFMLSHERAGYRVSIGMPDAANIDWIARVAEEDWATAEDVRQLGLAIRDLEYARWLGLLPTHLPAYPAADTAARMPRGRDAVRNGKCV